MTVKGVVRAVRRFWALALAVLGLFLLLGVAAAFLPAERYRAEAILFVQPSGDNSLEFGARESLDLLVPSIVRQVETQSFEDDVRGAMSRDLGDVTLTASSEPGTGVLTMAAESTDPDLAAAAANTAATVLEENRLTNAIEFSVLDPARPPESPASPRRGPILLGSFFLGLIAALFAVLIAASLRQRISGAAAIRERLGLTVLGEIPRSNRLDQPTPKIFRDPDAVDIVEEFQRLRANFELLATKHRAIAVTSWAQGEGKTSITAGLGWALASLGREVTVVDLDLRRPAIHTAFGMRPTNGIADVDLTAADAARQLSRITRSTELPELDVITAGVAERHPANIVGAAMPAIRELVADRLLLIDTPPLFTAETTMIASMVDALVIVIDARQRNPEELESVVQELRLTQTPVLGVVLNRVPFKSRNRSASYYHRS